MKRTTTTRARRISLRTILFSLALLLALFVTFTAAQEEEDDDISPDDPTSPDSPPSPSPDTPLPSPETPTQPAGTTPKPPTEPPITLPSVPYIPPVSFNINNDALEPIFPTGSESCQKCKYFYPKLKECNQIANKTLALLPRLVPGEGSNDNMTPMYPGANGSIATTTTTATASAAAAAVATQTGPPSTFSTIMPFLQCICPSQGLAATKVCLTCFRVSNQRNFLDQLTLQNVSNSLSAFQEACQDSNDGTMVPPAGAKGQSASFGAPSAFTSSWMMMVLVGVVSISFLSSFFSIL